MRQTRRPFENAVDDRGSALITAVLVAAAISIVMLALTSLRVSEIQAITSNVKLTQAEMGAEAGIESIKALIVRDAAFPTTPVQVQGSINDSSFQVSATPGNDPTTGEPLVTVVSQGTYDDAVRTIEAQLRADFENRLLEEYAILACHDLVIDGSSSVVGGDIYSGGNLTVAKGNGLVNGDARAYGDVELDQEGAVTGNVVSRTGTISGSPSGRKIVAGGYAANPAGESTLDPIEVGSGIISNDPALYEVPNYCAGSVYEELVEISQSEIQTYRTDAEAADTFLAGDQTDGTLAALDGGITDGETYFIDGDLTVNADFSASATFVIAGDLIINGNVVIGDPDDIDLALVVVGEQDDDGNYTSGNVDRGNGNATINGVLYANGAIDQGNGNLTINGSAIFADQSDTVSSTLSGNLTINYRQSGDINVPNQVFDDVNTSRWRLVSN